MGRLSVCGHAIEHHAVVCEEHEATADAAIPRAARLKNFLITFSIFFKGKSFDFVDVSRLA